MRVPASVARRPVALTIALPSLGRRGVNQTSLPQGQKFVPVILDYLRTKVGPDVVSKLEKTLRA